jgi:hypothetical protein
MEKNSKIIIATLVFSTLLVIANQKGNIGFIGEFVVLFYFVGLLYWAYYRRKNTEMYPYLAIIYFVLIVFASALQDEVQAILYSSFFFYTLLSILISNILKHFQDEK